MNNYKVKTEDTRVKSVIEQLDERSIRGYRKYGTTLDRDDLIYLMVL